MHLFKLFLSVVFTITSSAVFSALTEAALKDVEAIKVGIQPKFWINSKTPELSTLKERMAALNIPAVSIAFMESHKISWTLTEGVVDIVSQRKIDKNTVFQAVSISKPIFATALLKYREEQGLDLDSDVNKLLKSWQFPRHKWSKFSSGTLRRLLSDSAGVTVHGFKGYAAGESVHSIINVLKGAVSANTMANFVDIEPSTVLRNSSGETTLTRLVLQDLSRIPLSELTNTLTFDPLGIDHNSYSQPLSEQLAKNAAVPYRSNGLPVTGGAYSYATFGAAGLWTTPSDLLKLASKIQNRYQDLDKSLISNKTVTEMLMPQIESMGIGFFLEKQDDIVTSFSHAGANNGFRANLFIHPQTGDGIAIMTNSDNGRMLINDLMSRINEVYGWNEFSQIEKNVTVLKPKLRQLIIGENKVREPIQSTVVLVAEGEQF
jgi:CubicO group peptidase (beta-lactamase class C family)